MKTFILPIGIWLLACSPIVGTTMARDAEGGGPVKSSWFASERDALWAARVYATGQGGSLVETSGTPSMEPLIHGKTYAVIKRCPFDAVVKRDILVYRGRPDASRPQRVTMLHRAVMHDRKGWIMSGDNNRWSESWDRVTPETYIGTVKALFAFPNQ
jgi:hypothetical protein